MLVPCALAAVCPAYVLLTNHLVPFANDFHCDPWHYFGMFFLADQPHLLNDTSRMLSRVPEFMLGALITKLSTSIIADYLNFLLLYAGCILALFFAAFRLFGGAPALLATLFFAFNPIVVGNFAVTYTAPSLFYNLLALLLAVEAREGSGARRTLALVLSGVVLGTSVHGHLYAAGCAFAIPLYAIEVGAGGARRLLAQGFEVASKMILGIVLATIAIGTINKVFLGGEFLFFMQQLGVLAKVDTADYDIAGWFMKACRGAIFVLAAALPTLQLAALILRGAPDALRPRLWVVNLALAAIAALLLLDSWLGGFFLQYDYYYVLLLPHIALSLAALLAQIPPPRKALAVTLAVTGLILALALLPDIEIIAAAFASPDNAYFSLGIVLLLVIAAAVALFARNRRGQAASLATTLVLVGCLGFAVRPQRMGRLVWEHATRMAPHYGADNYTRIRQGVAYLAAHHFASRPAFWVSVDNVLWETIALARSFDYCIVEMKMPQMDATSEAYRRDFLPGREIVLVRGDPRLLEQANATLKPLGLTVREQERKLVSYEGVSYYVVIGRLESLPAG